jgi:hypothetical protein
MRPEMKYGDPVLQDQMVTGLGQSEHPARAPCLNSSVISVRQKGGNQLVLPRFQKQCSSAKERESGDGDDFCVPFGR